MSELDQGASPVQESLMVEADGLSVVGRIGSDIVELSNPRELLRKT